MPEQLKLPDVDSLSVVAWILTGSIGAALGLYGLKRRRAPQLLSGILISVLPMFVENPILMFGITAAAVAAAWYAVRNGM